MRLPDRIRSFAMLAALGMAASTRRFAAVAWTSRASLLRRLGGGGGLATAATGANTRRTAHRYPAGRTINNNSIKATAATIRRRMSAPSQEQGEKTEEERAAIKASREARK